MRLHIVDIVTGVVENHRQPRPSHGEGRCHGGWCYGQEVQVADTEDALVGGEDYFVREMWVKWTQFSSNQGFTQGLG